MPKRLTTEQFVERARKVHGDKYDYSHVSYLTNQTPVEIICPLHGPFLQRPNNHLQGSGCSYPDCCPGKAQRLTSEQFIEKARAIHGDLYDYSKVDYKNRETPVEIICQQHGSFWQKPYVHLQGCGCPNSECAKAKLIQTNMQKYGVPVTSQAESVKKKQAETNLRRYGGISPQCSEQIREKSVETLQSRYGAGNPMDVPEFREKISETMLDRYGVAWASQDDAIRKRQSETCQMRYGGSSPLCSSEIVHKVVQSRILNHTCNTSASEERAYCLLCDVFGSDDVIRQYRSVQYPFSCDFYVKSLDLYIEMNLHWSHGGAFYDVDNSEHQIRLASWVEKSDLSEYYANAIHVWTVRDLEKLRMAQANHLNYQVFWKNDLSDFFDWLNLIDKNSV